MNAADIPILLTSSVVAHDDGVKLSDSKARISYTLESISRWQSIAPKNPIVICDGSGFDFTELLNIRNNNREIECLSFQNSVANVKKFGRGYGEGEIVKHALAHSSHISRTGAFAKCSAKLWVENFHDCVAQFKGAILLKGVFSNEFSPSKPISFKYVDTRFYVSERDFYIDNFYDVHFGIRADIGYGLEECFKDKLLQLRPNNYLMYNPPIIYGVGGGTGKYYRNSLFRIIKDRIKYSIVAHSHEYQTFFS